MGAALTSVGGFIAYNFTEALDRSARITTVLAWMVAGTIVTYVLWRLQARSQEESPEALAGRLGQLKSKLREQVQIRSYGTRRDMIKRPLLELKLDITPLKDLVLDHGLEKPEPLPEKAADIGVAFASSKRRLLILGDPGSGKTLAAYSLVEQLNETEGEERIPLLVNLSAWEGQDTFEAFLVD